jgi:hypothetical protein
MTCLKTVWLGDFYSESIGTAGSGFSKTWQNALAKNVNLRTRGQIN